MEGYNPIDTEQCEGYVVDLMNAIETAGIGNIFSAGNDGPNNEGVKAPQRINSGIVNTFCVASLNANDENLNISTFSTRGPTQCPTEIGGSLEIYPEVAAPGQSIRSASGDDGFDVKSGTSMAAPNASGVAAIIRSYFPRLSASEVKRVLMNSGMPLFDRIKLPGTAKLSKPEIVSVSGKLINLYNALIYASNKNKNDL